MKHHVAPRVAVICHYHLRRLGQFHQRLGRAGGGDDSADARSDDLQQHWPVCLKYHYSVLRTQRRLA